MIRLDRVSKRYPDGTVAVQELTLEVGRGELVVLVGPSGCGKTTTMKMVNRLVEPTGGRIVVDGVDVTDADPVALRRGIGYVIQNVGLFPHRTIEENIAVVPELVGWPRKRRHERARELMELVGLDPAVHGKRYPHELSGGQRQRVGVARALAVDPPVLLMDEPFSAVDPVVRSQLQDEFLRLQDDVRKTILFVTHDIEEAVRLGDRIAVFKQGGRLEQFDTPAAILGAPATDFVADFVGADRGLKRLSVTAITSADLEHPPVVKADDDLAAAGAALGDERWAVVLDGDGGLAGWVGHDMLTGAGKVRDHARRMEAWVELDDSLKVAFAEMLQWNAGWIAVLDDDDRYVGVLTPATLHAALRRSVEAEAKDVARAEVVLETVQNA
ncbi:ABC transporter ATP-binding protein [Jiangella alba]|uniref:ABC-type quaternary amine transporter n=1 Tax=Jiangella alba TaxID=561176 RepID=A0A1H5PQE7_9ACTN|nr:betaine/proline/choline family ABC transporter ATP-binding protein [Jiangella alba]SEF16122.1 osmoprotectant transport system ATP-binding protein [Jiangella alba]